MWIGDGSLTDLGAIDESVEQARHHLGNGYQSLIPVPDGATVQPMGRRNIRAVRVNLTLEIHNRCGCFDIQWWKTETTASFIRRKDWNSDLGVRRYINSPVSQYSTSTHQAISMRIGNPVSRSNDQELVPLLVRLIPLDEPPDALRDRPRWLIPDHFTSLK